LLVDEGLVSGLDLAKALLHQREFGGKIIDILVALGAIDPDVVVNFLGRQPGIPSLKLCNYSVKRDVVSLVPKELAVKHEVFPIEILGKVLTLVMVCPLDKHAIAELEKATEFKVRPILCLPEDIRAAINRYYARKEEIVTLSWHTLQRKHSDFAIIDRK
jgi:type IV pilus assembly protein PilB